jgi:glycine/D-amino acid oxidase-like deaminating enzyme
MTETKEPIIKEIKPTVYAAAGLSGMGIAIGMQVAKEVVECLEK